MNDSYLLLTPFLTFLVVLLVGFVGCGKYLGPGDETVQPPERKQPEEKPPEETPKPTPPPTQLTYSETMQTTPGFLALWLLDDVGTNIAKVEGALNPNANGVYTVSAGGQTGTGYTLQQPGVRAPKDSKDYAVEFNGSGAYIEVPFVGVLNPDPAGTGFTIELWVKPSLTLGSDRHVLISSHAYESLIKQQGYEIGLLEVQGQTHHQVYARVYSGTGATMTEVTVQPTLGEEEEWRHVAFRYRWDGTKGSISLRVQLLTKESFGALPVDASYEQVTSTKQSTLRFAASHAPAGGAPAVAGCRLDNISIYNVALADTVLDDHFNLVV